MKARKGQQRKKRKISQSKQRKRKVRTSHLTTEQKTKRKEDSQRAKEYSEKKRAIKKERAERRESTLIQKVIHSILNSDALDKIAKATGFIKRKSTQLQAYAYMFTMSFGFFGNGEISLVNMTSTLFKSFDIDITPQALSKRINTKCSVKFLSTIFRKLLNIQIKINLAGRGKEVFSVFSSVDLQDSTQVSLDPVLEKNFKGSGGSASKSALKLDFIFDIANLVIKHVKLTRGTVPDVTLSKDIIKCVQPGGLAIRDLGYFEISTLRKIKDQLAYYISRLSISVNVYLNKEDKEKIDLIKFIKEKIDKDITSINQIVYIGVGERLETRLVVEKVPDEVSKQRQARYKSENRKAPSEYYTEWCGYAIFNIPPEMFSSKIIISLYKIRWQIELIFKNFKSNIELDYLSGKNKHRIESLVYGRLITISVLFIIQNYAAYIALSEKKGTKEVSGDKLTKWLITGSKLYTAILEKTLLDLLALIEFDIAKLCKQKRKKSTTLEDISDLMDSEWMEAG